MVLPVDTRPKSGIPPKVTSDSRIVASYAHSGFKIWHKRTCGKCKEVLLATEAFDTVARNKRDDVFVHHDHCRKCRAKIRAGWDSDPLFSPELESFWRRYMPGLRAGAYGRHLLVAVDVEDILGLYFEQRGLCAISGLELDWQTKGKAGRANKAHLRPSVDRIDSHGNYTIGNIQIVAQVVNLMKGALPQSSFIEICGAIARHNFSL